MQNTNNFSTKKEAEAAFKQQTLIDLTLRDTICLIESCINDSFPNEKLKATAKEFLKLSNLQ